MDRNELLQRIAELEFELEEEIDTSDIPEASEAWFKKAKLILPRKDVT